MAGDWIKFEATTPDKPEVVQMAARLGIDQDAVIGKLLRLWVWADQNSVDGNAATVTSAFLDRLAFCPNFAIAMRDVGWLIGDDGALTFPNFDRHNGKTAKARAIGNRRVVKHRACNGDGNDDVTLTPLHKPLQKALPEKRREEKKKKDQNLLSTATPNDPKPEESPKPTPQPPADLSARRAERIATVADNAIAAYNAILAKPKGLLRAVSPKVGRSKRQDQVRRVLQVASEICDDQFGDKRITPEFWETYFGACGDDPFHSGAGPYSGEHANWRPDFEFLTRPATMLKVFERATDEANVG